MKTAVALVALFVGAVAAAEVLMRPPGPERVTLVVLFGTLTAVAAVAAVAMTRLRSRVRTLRTSIALVAVAAVGTIAAVVVVATASMFLSAHDGRLALIALGFGSGLGLVLARLVGAPLTSDLQRIAAAATRLGDGDLQARTGVDRRDELGVVAETLDRAAEQLAVAEVERTHREETRRALFAALGHDLRTPLTALRAAVEALEDGVAPDPARYIATMRTDIDLLTLLVDDLLTLARIEGGEIRLDREIVDVAELADAVVASYEPLARPRNIALRTVGDRSAKLHGDAAALTRVLRNLVDNALRHTPGDASVTVEVVADAGHVLCTVHDDGPGFPPDFRQRALRDFTRSDAARSRAHGGSGLGLAIASRLAEAHGGRVVIDPPPGGHVRVELPTG